MFFLAGEELISNVHVRWRFQVVVFFWDFPSFFFGYRKGGEGRGGIGTYVTRSPWAETPRYGPALSRGACVDNADGPVGHTVVFEEREDRFSAVQFSEHACVPGYLFAEDQALLDKSGDKPKITTWTDHFDGCSGADGVWFEGLAVAFETGVHFGVVGEEGGVADCKVEFFCREGLERDQRGGVGRLEEFGSCHEVVDSEIACSRVETLLINIGGAHGPVWPTL